MLRILDAHAVRRSLPMDQAIAGMKEAFTRLAAGEAEVPLRSRIDVPDRDATTLVMPAYLAGSEDLALKIVTVFPGNAARNLPTIHAAVLVLDAATGRLLALMEGAALTAIRTGAASGAATDLLARPEASQAAILGSGAQARTQLEAICTVRAIRQVRVYSPTPGHAARFAAEMAGQGPIPLDIGVAASPADAVREADVICTATTSTTPVFDGQDLRPGAHINAAGSFTPAMRELDAATIGRARVFVDQREASLAEAGELIDALARGVIRADALVPLGELLLGRVGGRQADTDITLFKSVGVAVQDVVAARIALHNARVGNLGHNASF